MFFSLLKHLLLTLLSELHTRNAYCAHVTATCSDMCWLILLSSTYVRIFYSPRAVGRSARPFASGPGATGAGETQYCAVKSNHKNGQLHHSLSTVMQVEYASGPNLGISALRLQYTRPARCAASLDFFNQCLFCKICQRMNQSQQNR